MALTAAGLIEPARRAFDWCRRQQRADGSWPIQLRAGVVEDANSDSNFCAYVAVGVWHHVLVTGDRALCGLDVADGARRNRLRLGSAAARAAKFVGRAALRAR